MAQLSGQCQKIDLDIFHFRLPFLSIGSNAEGSFRLSCPLDNSTACLPVLSIGEDTGI